MNKKSIICFFLIWTTSYVSCRFLGSPKFNLCLDEKPFVVVIPSYNNELWVEKNLRSVLSQEYDNFSVIIIDDCSRDKTYHMAQEIIAKYDVNNITTLIHNENRHGALANLYTSIHECDDNAIIVTVDGDDWLYNEYVLSYLNTVYQDNNVWMTYGQFIEYPSNSFNPSYSQVFPDEVVMSNTFRLYKHLPISHLRTFYAWLFKAIKLEDMLYEGNFYTMTWDKVMMSCMIEMAGSHYKCIPDILYVYNNTNPISDHRIDIELQRALATYIAQCQPYCHLSEPITFENLGPHDTITLIMVVDKYLNTQDQAFIKNNTNFESIHVICTQNYVADTENTPFNLVYVDTQDLGAELIKILLTIDSNYILLQVGPNETPNQNLIDAIKLLKKTQANLYMLNLTPYLQSKGFAVDTTFARINRIKPTYACMTSDARCNEMLSHTRGMLWNRTYLLDLLRQTSDLNSLNFVDSFNQALKSWHILALFS